MKIFKSRTAEAVRERERERESHNLNNSVGADATFCPNRHKHISKITSNIVGALVQLVPIKSKHTNKLKTNTAITLIALIITIIVLLILSGITLSMVMGENGIIEKAEKSANEYTNSSEKELKKLNELEEKVEDYNFKIITAKKNKQEVEIRTDNELSNYFVLNKSIKDDVKSIIYTDESEKNKQVNNTNELIGGEHIINCKVLLNNGKEDTATTKLLVGKIVYISGPTNIDEYEGQELSIIGTTEDSSITTNNSDYLSVTNNLNLYNLIINAPAIAR